MRIPLVTGREFNDHDLADSPRVAIVTAMARRHWPSIDPVGKRFRINSSTPWVTIVGVARDAEQSDWGSPAGNEYYFPYTQNPEDFQRYITLVARTSGDPAALAPSIEHAVWSLDRDLPVADVQTMDQVVNRSIWRPRFSASLLGGFAALALAAGGHRHLWRRRLRREPAHARNRHSHGAWGASCRTRCAACWAKARDSPRWGCAIGIGRRAAAYALPRNPALSREGHRSGGAGGFGHCISRSRFAGGVAAREARHARRPRDRLTQRMIRLYTSSRRRRGTSPSRRPCRW